MPLTLSAVSALSDLSQESISQSATQGSVLIRGASNWINLAPGTSGQFLTSGGAGANPSWTTINLSGYVTQTYVDTADANLQSQINTNTTAISTKLPLAGGTLTGLLTLSGAPTATLHATTKAYVDSADSALNTLISGNTTAISGKVAKSGDSMQGNLLFNQASSSVTHGIRLADGTNGFWLGTSGYPTVFSNAGGVTLSSFDATQRVDTSFGNGAVTMRFVTGAGSGGATNYFLAFADGLHGYQFSQGTGTIIDNALLTLNYEDDYQWHSANLAYPYSATSMQMRVKSGQLQLFYTGSSVNDSTQDSIKLQPKSATNTYWRGYSQYANSTDTKPTLYTDRVGSIQWNSVAATELLKSRDYTTGTTQFSLLDSGGYVSFTAGHEFYFNNKVNLGADLNLTGNFLLSGLFSRGNTNATSGTPFTQYGESISAAAYNGGSPVSGKLQTVVQMYGNSATQCYATMGIQGTGFPAFTINLNGLMVGSQGINDASAICQIESTTKGFATPRMTTTQRTAISSPIEGLEAYDTTTHAKHIYTGSAWCQVIATDSLGRVVTPKALLRGYGSLTPSSGAVTPDASQGNTLVISTAVDLTINNPTNPGAWQALTLVVTNTDSASHAISLGTAFRFGDNVTSIAAVAAGKTAYIGVIYNSTDSKWDVVSNDGGH